MDPFEVLSRVQKDYRSYVETFQRFQNEAIERWIGERIENGTLLWKPPYIQLSRPFSHAERLEELVDGGLLHAGVLKVFRSDVSDEASPPVYPYRHQTEAVRHVLAGHNVIVATGTGSGKSFAFGIPIVSEALRKRAQGISGIKAVIVYPMNALANSQYDDLARRLHGTGVTIARYTGDTAFGHAEALNRYKDLTGRAEPYDSEVLSREEIQAVPPDILMTNYVMLELLLTRFDDRKLFSRPDVLQFLVLDEVHTYTGKRGADVAALVRRVKQHTHTTGALRCIATSATVECTGDESAAEAVAGFAHKLFGEPFEAAHVVTESYAPLPDDLPELTRAAARALDSGPLSLPALAEHLDVTPEQVQSVLLAGKDFAGNYPVPKVHAFFSQGRAIKACLHPDGPHLNDKGEPVCPICAGNGRPEVPTFSLVFCRACGQEFWSVAVDDDDRLHSADLDAVDAGGRAGYLMMGSQDIELPAHWLSRTGKVRKAYRDVVPELHTVCPICGVVDAPCEHQHLPVTFVPAPFLVCPTCGIVHDRRSREYNKLFSFGSVGRSTATDVLVNAQVQALPLSANKVIAFSDNRQDTALQAAHMNSLHHRFTFRQTLFTALNEAGCVVGSQNGAGTLADIGSELYRAQYDHGVLPEFRKSTRIFGRDREAEGRYQDYLEFVALWELGGTHRRTHQNLEDVGLPAVGYQGLDECAEADWFWNDVPHLADLDPDVRYDLLHGFLDLMRKRLAIRHPAIVEYWKFDKDVIARVNEKAHVHDQPFPGPIGYSDTADPGRGYTVFRISSPTTQTVVWIKRVFGAMGCPVDSGEAQELAARIVEKLSDPQSAFLVSQKVKGYGRASYGLWMVDGDRINLQADPCAEQWRCPKCGTVHRFRTLRVCTGSTCRTMLERRDLSGNYFRQVYATPLSAAVPVQAEEHSGQVSGEERRDIELRFQSADDPLNVLICTPTMELGIDIGHLNAVMLRNVPPSPSNYAQRAGRAGRSGQPALVTVFAGVGAARGPHDQYFYRFPEKMIAGAIAAPRFRLDNEALITAHIHALVLETMGLKGAAKLPGQPQDLLDTVSDGFPLFNDWRTDYASAVAANAEHIISAVQEAFDRELKAFEWFDEDFVRRKVESFVDDLDLAMDRWRREYHRLDEERETLNYQLGKEGVEPSLNRRRTAVESKLQSMREGRRDWYIYRHLGGEGFLPGYAFPPQATNLAFDDREEDLSRDPAIAIREYAPGNFVYFRGRRYEVTHAQPRSRRAPDSETPQLELDIEPVLVCPFCQRAYVGKQATQRGVCECGADLSATVHPQQILALTDMYSGGRARITADEEERMRLGYEVTQHYRAGGTQCNYDILVGEAIPCRLTIELGGEILLLNRGQREADGDPTGFALCGKCYRWLVGKNAPQEHIRTTKSPGKCPQAARAEDLISGLWLAKSLTSDIALLDASLPEGVDPVGFYATLLHTLQRALMVALNLDQRELDGFLVPGPDAETPQRIVLYETSVGGCGVLASLDEPGRLAAVFARACEVLHEGDPEDGCERACYECLLSFYNQRDHEVLDRRLVLPWLQGMAGLVIKSEAAEDRFADLEVQCESELERKVLQAIRDRALRLPDAAQRTVFDGDEPLAIADFFYEPRIVVFVDGSPHCQDYVQAADQRKRRRLKALGYRIVVVQVDDPHSGLDDLAARLAG